MRPGIPPGGRSSATLASMKNLGRALVFSALTLSVLSVRPALAAFGVQSETSPLEPASAPPAGPAGSAVPVQGATWTSPLLAPMAPVPLVSTAPTSEPSASLAASRRRVGKATRGPSAAPLDLHDPWGPGALVVSRPTKDVALDLTDPWDTSRVHAPSGASTLDTRLLDPWSSKD